jgi:hypothetical protein
MLAKLSSPKINHPSYSFTHGFYLETEVRTTTLMKIMCEGYALEGRDLNLNLSQGEWCKFKSSKLHPKHFHT